MNGSISAPAVLIPPFPTWPPPSGGAPFAGTESGPHTNPYPYGSPQPQNIATANPSPPALNTFFPDPMPPLNGQVQPGLPPSGRPMEGGPQKAHPFFSQIAPPPMMGPGPGVPGMETGPGPGVPPPGTTFPSGSFIS